ncbi:hypothetical protein BDW22DRAFT_31637 [Trametopsis cervina]|nr:hypothetical protein BDW22DRAFT_31637 [Trametopsis cervina]
MPFSHLLPLHARRRRPGHVFAKRRSDASTRSLVRRTFSSVDTRNRQRRSLPRLKWAGTGDFAPTSLYICIAQMRLVSRIACGTSISCALAQYPCTRRRRHLERSDSKFVAGRTRIAYTLRRTETSGYSQLPLSFLPRRSQSTYCFARYAVTSSRRGVSHAKTLGSNNGPRCGAPGLSRRFGRDHRSLVLYRAIGERCGAA